MTDLFQYGTFTSHSGIRLPWKFDADALTDGDIEVLAEIVSRKFIFSCVYGIPRGGLRLAKALLPYCKPDYPTLIVDDVLTTGASIIGMRENLRACGLNDPIIGVVIVSRCGDNQGTYSGCPDWVWPIMTVSEWAQCRATGIG